MKKLVLLMLCLSGCGTNNKVDVSPVKGEIDVVHKVDIEGAIKQINDACKQQYTDPVDQEHCFKNLVDQFFKVLDNKN